MSNRWKIAIVVGVIVAVAMVLASKEAQAPPTPDAVEQPHASGDDRVVQSPEVTPSTDEAPPEAKGTEGISETSQPSTDKADTPAASQQEKQDAQAATEKGDEVDRVIDEVVTDSRGDAATQEHEGAAADESETTPEREQTTQAQPQNEDETADKQLPRFVEVGAESCVPCKMMQPVLDKLRDDYAGELKIEFADVWKNPDLGKKYGVRSIPTQVIYDSSGEEVFRHMGYWPKEDIDANLKELGIVDS